MKAAVFHQYGGPGVLRYEDVPTPTPQPGEIVIKILATGINRLEHYLREGSYTRELPLPHILGSDAAGEIAAIGAGVIGFQVGERVIPMPGYPLAEKDWDFEPMSAASSYAVGGVFRPGTYAQFLSLPARWVVKDNTGLSPEAVATLPMVLTTSVRALRHVGEVHQGQQVLIQAGASGTGSMAIQIARAMGARVAATVHHHDKAHFVRQLGAELVIDTSRADLVKEILKWTDGRGADVVLDNLGGPMLKQSLAAVKRQGIVVAIGFVTGTEVSFDIRDFFFAQKQLRGALMGSRQDLEWGLELVKAGKVRPLLDQVIPLREAAEAHRLLAANLVKGNLVMDPWA
jgi:NADPH:quinone reductase-like Zn-dependent oxidoreductase